MDVDADGIPDCIDAYIDTTSYDPPAIVDAQSVLDANANISTDDTLRDSVLIDEDFIPGDFDDNPDDDPYGWNYWWTGGNYFYQQNNLGLQTVGANEYGGPKLFLDQTPGGVLDQINNDPFLAYAVQMEEDVLNRELIRMAEAAPGGTAALTNFDNMVTINNALDADAIRARDDFFMRQADAQSGRVLYDQNNGWVRTQQYVLKPNDSTVQLLNVTLRNNTELDTMEFTTVFADNIYYENLRQLPWDLWLQTQGSMVTGTDDAWYYWKPQTVYDWRYVLTTEEAPTLQEMSIKLTSKPGDRWMQESRTFYGKSNNYTRQEIGSETLSLSINGYQQDYTYTQDWQKAGTDEYWIYPIGWMYDDPTSDGYLGNNPWGFLYMERYGPWISPGDPDYPGYDSIQSFLTVRFYVVGDADSTDNTGISDEDYSPYQTTEMRNTIRDIWDALRVNQPITSVGYNTDPRYHPRNIGLNNLEIVIQQGSTELFDIIYTPMSRMLWRP